MTTPNAYFCRASETFEIQAKSKSDPDLFIPYKIETGTRFVFNFVENSISIQEQILDQKLIKPKMFFVKSFDEIKDYITYRTTKF